MSVEEKYFRREYDNLQIAGEEFAEKHQDIAGKLRLPERQRKDPFVERLMEAFSFLAGRIHERLDDDLPEFTGGLLEQLFPHFLRPFPSCAIAQLKPVLGAIASPQVVPKDCEVQTRKSVKYISSSGPDDRARSIEKTEDAHFIFRTCQETTLRPIDLKDVRLEDAGNGSALILKLQPHRNVTFDTLELKRLRLHLQGDKKLTHTLLMFFCEHVDKIMMRELIPGTEKSYQTISKYKIGIPGLSDEFNDEADTSGLLPYARQTFTGYRLLQEYFAFAERFFFIDIKGLDAFSASQDGHPFEIKIVFNKRISAEFRPTTKNILLHCVPIINLYDRPTEEVSITQRLPEYYIIPDKDRKRSIEIYAVKKVTGVSENQEDQFQYIPATSYDVLDSYDPDYEYKRFFSTVRRPVQGDMAETYIRIFGPSMENSDFPQETLSIEATLSNGFRPAVELEVGEISQPINFPAGIQVKNITRPTPILPNPERQNYLWALISHLNLSYTSLSELETFKSTLSLYNWSQSHNNPHKRKIQAMIKIHQPKTYPIFIDHGVIRGVEFRVEFSNNQNQFEHGEGDIYLFGMVLRQFLSQYVTINSFVKLTLFEIEKQKEYTWEPNLGKILPI